MPNPHVTVLLPVWNTARFVGEAIESILSQDYRDFELVIVDDASTDGTPAILAAWAARDPRVVLVRNETNLGVGGAANAGLRIARGQYIARQDADDVSLPGRLSAEVALLDLDPTVSFVSTNFEFMDEHGTVLRTERRDLPPEIIDFILNFGNAIGGHSQVMFRRELAMQGGGYDPSLTIGEDYELWTRLARLGRIVVLPQLGMRYRLHDAQVTASSRRRQDSMWVAFSGGLLSRYLGRELEEGEIMAAIRVWRGGAEAASLTRGHAVILEAFQTFAAAQAGKAGLVRRLRGVIAARLAANALSQLHDRDLLMAGRFFARALRWDFVSALLEPPRLYFLTLRSRHRRRASRRRAGR